MEQQLPLNEKVFELLENSCGMQGLGGQNLLMKCFLKIYKFGTGKRTRGKAFDLNLQNDGVVSHAESS